MLSLWTTHAPLQRYTIFYCTKDLPNRYKLQHCQTFQINLTAKIEIKLAESLTKPIDLTQGGLQGKVLSPLIFSLFIAYMEL